MGFIEDRFDLAKTFRRKLVKVPFNLDHLYWVEDKDFDLEYHVRHIRLPEPGDWRQLFIRSSRLNARPSDLPKPLWEVTVIEGLDCVTGLPEGCYAILSKFHHACVDGVSGADITEAIHSFAPNPAKPDASGKTWRGEKIRNLSNWSHGVNLTILRDLLDLPK